VIEIWDFGEPSQLVGVCMAPLHQFHAVYKVKAKSVLAARFKFSPSGAFFFERRKKCLEQNMAHFLALETRQCCRHYRRVPSHHLLPEDDAIFLITLSTPFFRWQERRRREMALSSALPVLSCNDWLPANDLVDGRLKGAVLVTVAAGTDRQMKQFIAGLGVNSITAAEGQYDSVATEPLSTSSSAPCTSLAGCPEGGNEPSSRAAASAATVEEEGKSISSLADGRKSRIRDNDAAYSASPSLFPVEVAVEEARRLPRVFDPLLKRKTPPAAFVTFTSLKKGKDGGELTSEVVVSPAASACADPKWDFKAAVGLPGEALLDPKRHLIIKLWHRAGCSNDNVTAAECEKLDLEAQHVIGFAAVDVSPLKAGFPEVRGWYNVMDFVGRCRGQIKVRVMPLTDAKRTAEKLNRRLDRRDSEAGPVRALTSTYSVAARYTDFPSHVVQHTEQVVLATPVPAPSQGDIRRAPAWMPPEVSLVDPEGTTHSFLRSKLSDLDRATDRLKRLLQEPLVRQDVPQVEPARASLSLEELEKGIRENLRALQAANRPVLGDVFSESTPEPRSHLPQPIRRTFVASKSPGEEEEEDVSGEIEGVFIRDDTLEDLGQIDWSRVLKSGGEEEDLSRLAPEGGNPSEDATPAPASRRRMQRPAPPPPTAGI